MELLSLFCVNQDWQEKILIFKFMENLLNKKCISHSHIKALTQEQIKNLLLQVKNWEFLESSKIVKEFKFGDFVQAMKFVNQIAEIAENEGHHPDISIRYNKVEITLWTHFVKGLSENDFIVAAKIENI